MSYSQKQGRFAKQGATPQAYQIKYNTKENTKNGKQNTGNYKFVQQHKGTS